jgi:hypothetical protein
MSGGFLAYILPVGGGGPVDPGFGVPGWPSHPISPGGPPPYPSHPIPPTVWPNPPGGGGGGPGGPPLGTWGGDAPWPGYATPPIAPGGQPPGIWGGRPPNYVDIGGPGHQPHPSHPIAPGGGGGGGGGSPPGIWGGSNEPFPTPPIYIGPPVPAPEPPPVLEWHSAWTPQTGWMTIAVPQVPAPTPST